jgi:hypothetical protein
MEEFEDLLLAAGHIATFVSRDPVEPVSLALRRAGYSVAEYDKQLLPDRPFGAMFELPAAVPFFTIRVSIRSSSSAEWSVSINPALPIRAGVVPSSVPTGESWNSLVQDCYRIARIVHDAISSEANSIRWCLTRDSSRTESSEPIPL